MKKIENILMSSQSKLLFYMGVQFLSMENIQLLAKTLASKISETAYSPDLIVGIERGGIYPWHCLSQEMQLPYTGINISRKKRYIGGIETDQILFFTRLLKKSQESPVLKKPFEYDGHVKKVIIIDDDCASMKTLEMAKYYLSEKGLESKTSVILNTPQGTPDFFADMQQPLSKLVQGNKRFPWTRYSPYFKDYKLWLENKL